MKSARVCHIEVYNNHFVYKIKVVFGLFFFRFGFFFFIFGSMVIITAVGVVNKLDCLSSQQNTRQIKGQKPALSLLVLIKLGNQSR